MGPVRRRRLGGLGPVSTGALCVWRRRCPHLGSLARGVTFRAGVPRSVLQTRLTGGAARPAAG